MAETQWIIVAPRTEEDVVNLLFQRALTNGIRIARVLWSDQGPLKLYKSAEDLRRDGRSRTTRARRVPLAV